MRAPVGWLADHVQLPEGLAAAALGEAFVRVGLEVESLGSAADAMSGPILIGRVLGFEDEPQKNGKIIRWCQVDVGGAGPRGIVCGAHNFAAGDLVVVALPGAVLPGPFPISARKTYGHVSDGMICSAQELGIGPEMLGSQAPLDDHTGILVLPGDAGAPGEDALAALGLREPVLELAVTPDRGYCLSMRGLAREAASALGVPFRDVADTVALPEPDGAAYDVHLDDPTGCTRFSMRALSGLDPAAPTPQWLTRRLRQAGMRPISLAVDVTNYVMLETGQPLHAYDRATVSGAIAVRRAQPGERLTTLDGNDRALDPGDLLITDDSGPIGLAGVMGGERTEIGPGSTDLLLEAAHFDPSTIARTVRRHRLPSEAAKRFERGVDPQIAGVALQRCVELLERFGAATASAGYTVEGSGPAQPVINLDPGRPAALVGMPISKETAVARLTEVGCAVGAGDRTLRVRPPSWRPDQDGPADLVEEIARLEGYDKIPSELPAAPAAGGLTDTQRLRRDVSRALASAGATEVLTPPFMSPDSLDVLGLSAADPRRATLVLANPLSEKEPLLRTTLLPGLLAALHRNLSRGTRDLALFETGLVFRARPGSAPPPEPGVAGRPSEAEIAAMYASLPDQPRHAAIVLCGDIEPAGWFGAARAADWTDAIEFVRVLLRSARAGERLSAAELAPWHPGRCAQFSVGGQVIGHAGELHPRVVEALGLPERTCAAELNLDLLPVPAPARAPAISAHPPTLLDIALTVPESVPAADVLAAVRAGAGELLESAHLFDVYTDEARLGAGMKSLAFALRFHASDRTLTVEEASAARDAAVAKAAETGARLRT
jgi:phenylalanyl-tRNA synthetase beta chain